KKETMNNYHKFSIKIIVILLTIPAFFGCTNFLDEEQTTQRDTAYSKTPEGIEDLATGTYYNLRIHFASVWEFATTNYGTDEFRVGGDASNGMWDSYAGSFSSLITAVNVNTVMANTLWDNMYVGINAANLLIENAQAYLPDGAQKDRYLGEAYFMRAFNY